MGKDSMEEQDPLYEEDDEWALPRENEKLTVGLLIAGCCLCLGIIGVLIYWLEAYL